MTSSRNHFESFQDHTRLKHVILKGYLLQWATITLSQRSRLARACFCDAFAGAGRDKDGLEGSPIIAAEAARRVREMGSIGRIKRGASLQIALIEADAPRFKSLQHHIAPYLAQAPGDFLIRHGTCTQWLPHVRHFASDAPLLTFLDPFGIDGLDASYYPLLLSGPRDEVFVLVSDVGASRLHGILTASSQSRRERLVRTEAALSLFTQYHDEDVAEHRREVEDYEALLDVQKPAAHAKLLRALGSEDRLERLGKASKADRPVVFVQLLAEALENAGASEILTIPMRDAGGAYKYSLLHASKSPRAVVAMKDAVSAALNSSDLAVEMRARIRDDLSVSVDALVDWIATILDAQRYPWARGGESSLQDMLLTETTLFPFQLGEVRTILTERGLLRHEGRKLFVEFPPLM